MLTIACLSQKGGVGKSTLTRLIARTYAAAGWQVRIADFNTKQKTSVDWAADRMNAGVEPAVMAAPFATLRQAVVDASADLVVMDGKPDSDATSLDLAKAATLIIIPTGVTKDDIAPQIRFANELLARGIPREKILVVLNKTTDSQNWIDATRVYFQENGYRVCETELPTKTAYMAAQNAGKAISETGFPSLNDRADALMAEIVTRLKELTQ